MHRALLILAAMAAAASAAGPLPIYAQVVNDHGSSRGIKYISSASPIPNVQASIAWGQFVDSINQTGWATLEIHTNASYPDSLQAYAAGYLEGVVSQAREYMHLLNMCLNKPFSDTLVAYLTAQWDWMRSQSNNNARTSSFWYHVGLALDQQEGMFDGYNDAAPTDQQLSWMQYYCGTLDGDLYDLRIVFPDNPLHPTKNIGDGHCSVLIKPVGDPAAPTDLFIGHTNWAGFESMTRIYKSFDLSFRVGGGDNATFIPGKQIAYASYPATLPSVDDWYTTSAGLVITETTIKNNNATLWQYVVPETVPDWTRNMVANRLATSGESWSNVFKQHNSGTYNNQFMVLDYKLFTPGAPLRDGLLYVFEQMPGPYYVYADHTNYLRAGNQSYWASYNRIASPFLYNITNQTALLDAFGDHFSYTKTSRAVLFREKVSQVVDEESFKLLMRYNNFEEDSIATQGCKNGGRSASNAIAERGDLTPLSADCIVDIAFQDEVATDLKYTNYARSKNMQVSMSTAAICGPTYVTQPVFSWLNTTINLLNVSHFGQPDVFNFPYVEMTWEY